MKRNPFLTFTALLALATTTLAADLSTTYNVDKDKLALQGYDPVSYFNGGPKEGNKTITSQLDGITYRFANADNKNAFDAEPNKYKPAYGGWCATAMADGKKVEIDPHNYKITNGRLFLFFKAWYANAINDWNKDEKAMTTKADAQWKKSLANRLFPITQLLIYSINPINSEPPMKLSTPLTILSWSLRILAALILLQTLFFKFTGAPESVYIFSKLGAEPWGRIGSGIAELITAILLLNPRTITWGALAALAIMAGAIGAHLTVLGISIENDGGLLFGLAVTVFAAALALVAIHRKLLPILRTSTAAASPN